MANKMRKRLLIVDDEDNMRHMLTALLSKLGYTVNSAIDGLDAFETVRKDQFDFILCDIKMPRMNGMEFLEKARNYLSQTTVIMMSAFGTIDMAIEAMKLGAYDYISKPFKTDEVYLTLKKAEERESLRRENLQLKERIKSIEEKYSFANMIGKSKPMQEVFKLASKASQYDSTVIIFGESGTGKELIAKAIHFEGVRAENPFIPVNCGGIPESLLESEFFGYEKGAFTGADRNKKGLFEDAHKGTIFLDEVGELPLSLQVKFLRVLQENEIRSVGSTKPRKIDVRVVAATSKNLEEEIKNGNFRHDLYYRLNVLPIRLPPLRERREDIPLLCDHFINRYKLAFDKGIERISSDALSMLMRHHWPGNVRELENAIERAVILCEDTVVSTDAFSLDGTSPPPDDSFEALFGGLSIKESQQILEKKLIVKALEKTKGNRTRAIQLLGISHPSLLSKIKLYQIDL